MSFLHVVVSFSLGGRLPMCTFKCVVRHFQDIFWNYDHVLLKLSLSVCNKTAHLSFSDVYGF